jgi:hypothetical protein
MSYTKEVTLWCDATEQSGRQCVSWIQFAHPDAGGSVVDARKLAQREGWDNIGEHDFCRTHNPRRRATTGASQPIP